MANVHDVAAFIQRRTGGVDRLKLQKLVYYCQAWTLVWDNRPLFSEPIEAWRHGPVAPALWRAQRDLRVLLGGEPADLGNAEELTEQELENIDAVIDFYNQFSGWELRHRTHTETPWRRARGTLDDSEPSREVISLRDMRRCYARIEADDEPRPLRQLVDEYEEISDDELELVLKQQHTDRPEHSTPEA